MEGRLSSAAADVNSPAGQRVSAWAAWSACPASCCAPRASSADGRVRVEQRYSRNSRNSCSICNCAGASNPTRMRPNAARIAERSGRTCATWAAAPAPQLASQTNATYDWSDVLSSAAPQLCSSIASDTRIFAFACSSAPFKIVEPQILSHPFRYRF